MPKQNTSPAGREFIKTFEALRLKAYKDPIGIWTIGYGHTRGVVEGMEINEANADSFLSIDLLPGEEVINSIKTLLLQNEFDALSSLIFNIGVGNFKRSTLYKHLFANAISQVPNEFLKWNKARNQEGQLIELPGLTRRRKSERELFMNGVYTTSIR